jgi:hypothetical protein
MRKKMTAKAVAVLVVCTGLMASTVAAHPSMDAPMPNGTLSCAGHTMTRSAARHSVIVTLIIDKPHTEIAFGVRYFYKGNNYVKVGYAHADCWTAIPLTAGKILPNLCLAVSHPYMPEPSTNGRPAACPSGEVIRYKGVRWVTYTFHATY